MNGAFYIGATGLHSQERALEVVANNIANINTPGFKRSEVRFSELVRPPAEPLDPAGVAVDTAAALSGVAVDASSRVFAQGDLKATGNPLDVAVSGEGFIELLGPAGQGMLWRGGALKVDRDGYLAAANGMPLKAMISVPLGATGLSIGRDGTVRATAAGEAEAKEIGRIELVAVKDMTQLSAVGDGLYRPGHDGDLVSLSPEDGGGALVQGSIEGSNVQLADEMVTLLLMQRAFAANAQIVQAGDQLMSIANGLKR